MPNTARTQKEIDGEVWKVASNLPMQILLHIEMKLVAIKVHLPQNERPNFGPFGNFRVLWAGVKWF